MFADAAVSGLDDVDLWVGGLAEKPSPFGGLLGPTFSYIFEIQLENLQNADRFYYLERLDGLNFLSQLEGNSFAELIARNTTLNGANSADVFARPDIVFNMSAQAACPPGTRQPAGELRDRRTTRRRRTSTRASSWCGCSTARSATTARPT